MGATNSRNDPQNETKTENENNCGTESEKKNTQDKGSCIHKRALKTYEERRRARREKQTLRRRHNEKVRKADVNEYEEHRHSKNCTTPTPRKNAT